MAGEHGLKEVCEYQAVDFHHPLNPALSNHVYSHRPFLCPGEKAGNPAELTAEALCCSVQGQRG